MVAEGEELPFIDRHSMEVAARPGTTWAALNEVLIKSLGSRSSALVARGLGCAETDEPGVQSLSEGATIPGFRVVTLEPWSQLTLAGEDRFSKYSMIFRLTTAGADGTDLSAETRAAFPGLKGSLFRSLVIGTRAHVLVVRRMLRAVKRQAEG